MRTTKAGQTHVCLSCLLRNGLVTNSASATLPRGTFITTSKQKSFRTYVKPSVVQSTKRRKNNVSQSAPIPNRTRTLNTSSTETPHVVLSGSQRTNIGFYHILQKSLKESLTQIPEAQENPSSLPIETLLALVKTDKGSLKPFVEGVEKAYAGRQSRQVIADLEKVAKHRRQSSKEVSDVSAINILTRLGVLNPLASSEAAGPSKEPQDRAEPPEESVESTSTVSAKEQASPRSKRVKLRKVHKVRIRKAASIRLLKVKTLAIRKQISKATPARQAAFETFYSAHGGGRSAKEVTQPIARAPPDAKNLDGSLIEQTPIEKEATLPVPKLSFDLSRVLFNPGVYHLQDPRSRVYNFDPYLEKIMPVSEFNFQALNPYITSSQDHHLRDVSLRHNKRYIGSSSSMSGAMSQFHFLLSGWRLLDTSMLSKQIEASKRFTVITRAPSAIFLRWRDGVYAVDADKEHDTPNILMMQGKSMEKLLTLEKDDFEKYRKPKVGEQAPAIDSDPESFHYSACENFLLRSQLDAWDPRLPGTGMFDLKTRACAGIRMDMDNHEQGMGYQIKGRFGEWESFDREYADMMRAAFLKYSLQVRMGRMDGIFVAYHNIERIFGFQYISLAELDNGLHGQTDPCLGDQEFKVTVSMMNEIFDLATKEFPEQSLRFMFETREATKTQPNNYMRVFAEPMSEEQVESIQNQGKAKVEQYERNLMMGIPNKPSEQINGQTMGGKSLEAKISLSTLESNAGDLDFLKEIMRQDDGTNSTPEAEEAQGRVAGWEIRVFNEVDGTPVIRPEKITSSERWVVKYTIQPINEARVQATYRMTQSRRAAALSNEMRSSNENYFIQRIRNLSKSGRTWRDEQDEIDSQREKVVLYNMGQ